MHMIVNYDHMSVYSLPPDHADADRLAQPFQVTQDVRVSEDAAGVDQEQLLC